MARDSWCKAEEVDDLVAMLDVDGDGLVSREEMRKGLAKHESGTLPLTRLMALRPPPSGPGIFGELLRAGGPVGVPLAEERAMSLRQLKHVLAHAQRRCASEGWIGKRFSAGHMRYEQITPREINLYEVASHVLLPATHGARLPNRDVAPSYVELVANGAQRTDYFVSHWWGESVQDFVACISQHTRDRGYGGGVPPVWGHDGHDAGKDGDDGLVWVCAYANRQWSLCGDVSDDPSQTSFHRAIRMSKGTIAIVDREAKYFTRIWCDYEIVREWDRSARAPPPLEREPPACRRSHARIARPLQFVSLTRKADAGHEAYTYDMYTAVEHTPLTWKRFMGEGPPPRLQAVGLLDSIPSNSGQGAFAEPNRELSEQMVGMAAVEMRQNSWPGPAPGFPDVDWMVVGEIGEDYKSYRESAFPPRLLAMGMRAALQAGQASVDSDQRHILNAIAGRPLDGPPVAEHPQYDYINSVLHSKLAEVRALWTRARVQVAVKRRTLTLRAPPATSHARTQVSLEATIAMAFERPPVKDENGNFFMGTVASSLWFTREEEARARGRTMEDEAQQGRVDFEHTLKILKASQTIKSLKLSDQMGGITGESLNRLLPALPPSLETLDISGSNSNSFEELTAITAPVWGCKHLKALHIEKPLDCDDDGIAKGGLTSLEGVAGLLELETLFLDNDAEVCKPLDLSALKKLKKYASETGFIVKGLPSDCIVLCEGMPEVVTSGVVMPMGTSSSSAA